MNSYLDDAALFALDHGPSWMRRLAIRRLARGAGGLTDATLTAALRHPDLGVRLVALEAVASHPRWQDLDLLRAALHDPHEAVRTAAARVLGQYRSVRVGRHLQTALGDPHPRVRAAAAHALGQIPTMRFSAVLEKALADEDSEVRACVARALGRVGRVEALVSLRVMAARDPVYRNRRIARRAIEGVERRTTSKEQKKRQAMVELARALLDDLRSWEERERAKACLIRVGDESSIQVLEQALEDTNDVEVHFHIVDVLAKLSPCRQLQIVLIGCLRHISPPVRHRAIVALGIIGDKRAIYYLDEVIRGVGTYPWTEEDAGLASEAVQKIEERARKGYSLGLPAKAVR